MAKSTNSSGTPSSPSMTRPDASRAVSCDGMALLRELTALAEALDSLAARSPQPVTTAHDAGTADDCGPALMLARVVPGLTPAVWQTFVRDHPEAAGWFALPVNATEHPNLSALGHGAKARAGASIDVGRLVCQETGLLLNDAFMERFARLALESRSSGNDLVLVLFELVDDDPDAPVELARTLRALARGCDIPGRLGERRMGLVMPGTGALRARGFAERVMVAFVENRPAVFGKTVADLPLKAGLACFDAESAPDAARLVEQAEAALELAKPGDAKTFRRGGEILDERKTQVQASEKQFLFFGATKQ